MSIISIFASSYFVYGMSYKRLLWMCLLSGFGLSVAAQEHLKGAVSADVVTSYIWRGQQYASISLQPTASLAYKGISLTVWGSFALDSQERFKSSQRELDFALAYAPGPFHVQVTDYFVFGSGVPYFDYTSKTAHTLEVNVGYDFGLVSANWFTNFAGSDGLNNNGNRAYSSYFQLDTPFHLLGVNWMATVGIVPFSTDYYSDDSTQDFRVNQLALQAHYEVKIGRYTLPIFGQAISNPSSQSFYFVAGFNLHL